MRFLICVAILVTMGCEGRLKIESNGKVSEEVSIMQDSAMLADSLVFLERKLDSLKKEGEQIRQETRRIQDSTRILLDSADARLKRLEDLFEKRLPRTPGRIM